MTTILDEFAENVTQFQARRGVVIESPAQGEGAAPPLHRIDEAATRADRLARIPVGTFQGISIYINPTMKDNTWRLIGRGLGRAEMNKNTFAALALEIRRTQPLFGLDGAEMLR